MAVLKGQNLLIQIGTKVYGYATSCDLDVNVDTKDLSPGNFKQQSLDGQWKVFEAGQKGWSVSSEYLVGTDMADVEDLFDVLAQGQEIDIKFALATKKASVSVEEGTTGALEVASGAKGFKGKGIITSFKISAQNESDSTYSINITGTGALEKNTSN